MQHASPMALGMCEILKVIDKKHLQVRLRDRLIRAMREKQKAIVIHYLHIPMDDMLGDVRESG